MGRGGAFKDHEEAPVPCACCAAALRAAWEWWAAERPAPPRRAPINRAKKDDEYQGRVPWFCLPFEGVAVEARDPPSPKNVPQAVAPVAPPPLAPPPLAPPPLAPPPVQPPMALAQHRAPLHPLSPSLPAAPAPAEAALLCHAPPAPPPPPLALLGVPEARWEHLALEEQVGVGGFGTVWRARWDGNVVAVKRLAPGAAEAEFWKELELMRGLKPHANVLRLLGASARPLALVTEFCSRGSLYGVLHSPTQQLSWVDVARFAHGVAAGMTHLHSGNPPVLHRDLKSANVLVDENWGVRVADFGLSRHITRAQTMTGGLGTFQWTAPEVLAHQRYSEKADVYSFGILLWEMCCRQIPFSGLDGLQTAMAVIHRGLRPDVPAWVPAPFAATMRDCWDPIASRRPLFPRVEAALYEIVANPQVLAPPAPAAGPAAV